MFTKVSVVYPSLGLRFGHGKGPIAKFVRGNEAALCRYSVSLRHQCYSMRLLESFENGKVGNVKCRDKCAEAVASVVASNDSATTSGHLTSMASSSQHIMPPSPPPMQRRVESSAMMLVDAGTNRQTVSAVAQYQRYGSTTLPKTINFDNDNDPVSKTNADTCCSEATLTSVCAQELPTIQELIDGSLRLSQNAAVSVMAQQAPQTGRATRPTNVRPRPVSPEMVSLLHIHETMVSHGGPISCLHRREYAVVYSLPQWIYRYAPSTDSVVPISKEVP